MKAKLFISYISIIKHQAPKCLQVHPVPLLQTDKLQKQQKEMSETLTAVGYELLLPVPKL